jgi:serine protease Do
MLAAGVVAAAGPGDGDAPEKAVDRRIKIVRNFGGGSYLGVSLNDAAGDARGAIVSEVTDDTPAAKAGLKAGDAIVKFDGETVRSAAHLARLVRETPAGRAVSVEVRRDGAPIKLELTLERRDRDDTMAFGLPPEPPDAPEPPHAPRAPRAPHPPLPGMFRWHNEGDADGFEFLLDHGPRKLGIRYQEISGQLAKYFRLAGDEGVLVADVDATGPAGKAGLKAGDVILTFNGKAVRDGDALRRAVSDAEAGSVASLSIWRDGKPLDLKVTLAGEKKEKAKGQAT